MSSYRLEPIALGAKVSRVLWFKCKDKGKRKKVKAFDWLRPRAKSRGIRLFRILKPYYT